MACMNKNPAITYKEMPTFSYSLGNSKIGTVLNVNLPAIAACHHDAPCRKINECYATKFHPCTTRRYHGNHALVKKDMATFFHCVRIILGSRLEEDSAVGKKTYFRWHVAGDIINQKYLDSMIDIAEEFPAVNFLVFTKMYNLNYAKVPKNLSVIFSMWPGWGRVKKGARHAWLWDSANDPRIPKDCFLCPGECQSCGLCWHIRKVGRDVVFVKHPVGDVMDRQLRESFRMKYGNAAVGARYPLGRTYAGVRPFIKG